MRCYACRRREPVACPSVHDTGARSSECEARSPRVSWFALVPLFETFGLTAIADLVGWFLIGALFVGYGQLASALYWSGYVPLRLAFLLPAFAAIVTLADAIVVAVLPPELRSPEATLYLTVVGFVVGVPAYSVHTVLPIAAHRVGIAPILARRWHLVVLSYAQGSMVLIGFLLLSVLRLA